MQLVKQNEKVISSRQGNGVSLVIRETEYNKVSEPGDDTLGYLTQYVVGQDLPLRKEFYAYTNLHDAQRALNRISERFGI